MTKNYRKIKKSKMSPTVSLKNTQKYKNSQNEKNAPSCYVDGSYGYKKPTFFRSKKNQKKPTFFDAIFTYRPKMTILAC